MCEYFDKRVFMLNSIFFTFTSLLVFAILTFGCSAGSVTSNSIANDVGKLSAEETLQYRSCREDTDCIYAQNGCCDCANGGEAIAVKINKLVEFEALFECENVVCTEIAAVTPCGQGIAKCEAGVCEFTKITFESSAPSAQ